MIATLKFKDGKTATLEDTGDWTCSDETTALVLNTSFSPRKTVGPDQRYLPGWGREQARRAGAKLGATVEYAVLENSRPGAVY